jgi:autotransporter-associated beta strand protein
MRSRTRRLLEGAAASVLVVGASAATSQGQVLFTTLADFGGSTYVNNMDSTGNIPQPNLSGQSGYQGFGDRGPFYGQSGVLPYHGDESASVAQNTNTSGKKLPAGYLVSFNGPDLDGSTVNGIANYDNNNDPPFGLFDPNTFNVIPDAQYTGTSLVSFAGKASPGASATLLNFQGGYTSFEGGNQTQGGATNGAANIPFVNTITQNGANQGMFKISFTTPLAVGSAGSTGTIAGTVTNTSSYFLVGMRFFDLSTTGGVNTNTDFATGWGSPVGSTDPTDGNAGSNHGAVGSYVVNNGTYFTAYIPYYLAGNALANPSLLNSINPVIIINSDPDGPYGASNGNVTIDDIEVVPLHQTYVAWSQNAGGSWGSATNWEYGDSTQGGTLGAVPQNAGDIASFLGNAGTQDQGILAPSTITLDGNRTIGNINFQSTNSYTLAPGTGGSLVFDNGGLGTASNINVQGDNTGTAATHFISAGVILHSSLTVNPVALSGVNISGNISGAGGITKNGAGTLTLSGTNTYGGATTINSGLLQITNKSAFASGTNLTVGPTSGGTVQFALPSGFGRVTLSGLTVNTGSTFDIANNGLQINFGAATDPTPGIAAALATGYNAGKWTGTGIVSSAAALNPSEFSVGYLDGNVASDRTAHTVAANQAVVRYTLAGDAFLEGTVGFDDLVVVAQNFGFTGQDWAGGNFNYDPSGSVGFPDLVNVAQNFGFSLGISNGSDGGGLSPAWQSVGASSVPEPTSIGLAALAAAGLLSRRRRTVN